MNKTIMAAIRAHALEESPRECCGFVIQSGRRQRYIPVPNTHENPTEHFRIDGEHWANAEDIGTIIASSTPTWRWCPAYSVRSGPPTVQ
jgi:proteasome lid subunit RPN8/RPN11